MSDNKQNNFETFVDGYFQKYAALLRLAKPTFQNDGFITTATMIGAGGKVELRCGPAEYHLEIFITTLDNPRQWSLADLLAIDSIRTWTRKNHPETLDRSRLEAEIDYAFHLLVDALKSSTVFEWIWDPDKGPGGGKRG
jgi:hypothetical protein